MKPICFPCQRFFRPKKNGFHFTEGMPVENSAPPGTAAPDKWRPYKLWVGDLWECPGCGATILSGTGASPIRVQHEADFAETAKRLGSGQYQVNDC